MVCCSPRREGPRPSHSPSHLRLPWNVGHASCLAVWGCVVCPAAALSSHQPHLPEMQQAAGVGAQVREPESTRRRKEGGMLQVRPAPAQSANVPVLDHGVKEAKVQALAWEGDY